MKTFWSFSAGSYLIVGEKYPFSQVINVTVAISHPLDDLYPVILPHDTIGYAMVKVIENFSSTFAGDTCFQLAAKYTQRLLNPDKSGERMA